VITTGLLMQQQMAPGSHSFRDYFLSETS